VKDNAKCKNSRFDPPFGGLRDNGKGSSMARLKAHCWLPISDNWTFFTSSHGCNTIKRNLSKSAFSEGVYYWNAIITILYFMYLSEFWIFYNTSPAT